MSETQQRADSMDVDELGIDEGRAVCLNGAHGQQSGRVYMTVVGDTVLEISSTRIREMSVDGAHYECASALRSRETTLGEAFEFLHGEYEPEITLFCLGCGKTHPADEDSRCGCPVGSETDSVDWPEIPSRDPRSVVDGQLVVGE